MSETKQQVLDDLFRPRGVRFCEEVPDKECHKCKLNTCGHPLVRSLDWQPDYEVFNKLCIKDCLKMKLPMKHLKESNEYKLEEKP